MNNENENVNANVVQNVSENTVNNSVTPKKKATRIVDLIAYLLCLVVAFGIWAYVIGTENNEYEYVFTDVVVNLEGVNELKEQYNLSPISGFGTEIKITVKGLRSEIANYTSDDIFAYVDLGFVNSADRHSLEVKVDLPGNIELVSAEPSKVNVFVDETVEKQVDIKVDVLYTSADNLTVYPADIDDADILNGKVTVSGPKTVIDSIDHALIVKDLGEVTTGVKFNSAFTLIDSDGVEINNPYIKTDVSEVSVSVKVTVEKMVALNAIYEEVVDPYRYTVVWKYDGEIVENVRIVGDPLVVSNYETINIEIPNIATVKNGNVALPDNIHVYVGENKISTISYTVIKELEDTN